MKLVFVYWGYEKCRLHARFVQLRTRGACDGPRGDTLRSSVIRHPRWNIRRTLAAPTLSFSSLSGLQTSRSGDRLDWARLLTAVPRSRRVVIDADGGYNDPIEFKGDYNHRTEAASREWCNVCDSLTDKICQPTLRPCRANVRPFLLTSYDPTREAPLDFSAKSFGMIYVGHSKFRWHGMSRVLRAIEPVRDRVEPVAIVGEGWAAIPEWAETLNITEQYYVDREYLKQLDVQVLPPVPYAKVIATMGQAVFNPVVQRPLFEPTWNGNTAHVRDACGGDHPNFSFEPVVCSRILASAPSSWSSKVTIRKRRSWMC